MSLEKSFVDQVALLAIPEDPTSATSATLPLQPANSEILDTSLIARNGKVLKTNSVFEIAKTEIKPEFDWNNDNLEEYLTSSNQEGINTVFADVIVPEVIQAEEENLIEIEVPVVIQEQVQAPEPKMKKSLDQVWSGDSMFDEEMIAVNPHDVHRDTPEAAAQAPEDEFDILKFVMDETIQPDDPDFVEFTKTEEKPEDLDTIDYGALVGPSTSQEVIPEVIKEEPLDLEDPDWTVEEPQKKRGRGRPRLPRPYPEPPKRPRGRPPTASTVAIVTEYDTSSAMSEEEQKAVRYRRMRDLNNAASKRCRINRKRKFEVMEDEQALLERKNISLKTEVESLEARVEKAKKIIHILVQTNLKKKNSVASTSTVVAEPSEAEAANVITGFDLDAFVNAEIDKY